MTGFLLCPICLNSGFVGFGFCCGFFGAVCVGILCYVGPFVGNMCTFLRDPYLLKLRE